MKAIVAEIDVEQDDVALDSELDPFEFYRFLQVTRAVRTLLT
jgi:hypothetical protein